PRGRDAPRPREAEVDRARLDDVGGFAVLGIGEPAADRLPQRAVALLLCALLEIAAVGVILHRLKAVLAQLLERVREVVNRIIGPRPRAVAARVVSGKKVGLKGLLSDRDAAAER